MTVIAISLRRRVAVLVIATVWVLMWAVPAVSLPRSASALSAHDAAGQTGEAGERESTLPAVVGGLVLPLTETVDETLDGTVETLDETVEAVDGTLDGTVAVLDGTLDGTVEIVDGVVGGLVDTVEGVTGELDRGAAAPAPPPAPPPAPAPPPTAVPAPAAPPAPDAVTEPAAAPAVPAPQPPVPATPDASGATADAQTPESAAADPGDDAASVATAVAERAVFPVGLLFLVLGFLAVQDRIDRRDPKLALAPNRSPDLSFERGGAA